jgi:hypothetical protein
MGHRWYFLPKPVLGASPMPTLPALMAWRAAIRWRRGTQELRTGPKMRKNASPYETCPDSRLGKRLALQTAPSPSGVDELAAVLEDLRERTPEIAGDR